MVKKKILRNAIIETVKTIFDTEIPVNIYELGLIYEIKLGDDFNAHILMTLTSPNCPVAESLPGLRYSGTWTVSSFARVLNARYTARSISTLTNETCASPQAK